jgi:formylglycine-generating enzyme required for sulfatase activity
MMLIADCLIDDDGKYKKENCNLSKESDDLNDAFYIDKYPVTINQIIGYLNEKELEPDTVTQWLDWDHQDGVVDINANGDWDRREGKTDQGLYPVIAISRSGASQFCQYYGGFLPTQEQWEFAAHGALDRDYPWGNNLISDYANYNESNIGGVVSVKAYDNWNISPFDVRSMVGNVWEWTVTTVGSQFALKGGSYKSSANQLKITSRLLGNSTEMFDEYGFRCICSRAVECYSSLMPTPVPNP